ncbi:DNA-3-methyladenine glycosylase 2 family protein [Siculibacillus lacustris]|uniref:DNA-3-methyladenine glycosylase II n=1 Tax=Siculibacillus lacustris TaxID=1549641 RepID=A0A4Q9VNF7_9HYPH|nr:DNA-3-methyladenine glycosylase [Siculibacillus lacustris]TBW36254.1 DNA-3-methyladenine glycosylase 2 family protein [Siculibacillus lacustris]
MRPIETDEHVALGLAELRRIDSRLGPVIDLAGSVPLRRRPPGFEGLARIVVAQQVSAAAATSIWAKLEATLGAGIDRPVTAATIASHDDATLRGAGLSAGKVRTLRAIAAACEEGLDLAAVADHDAAEAIEKLVLIKGIGPWTAEVFLLFCAGHPDVWPAGDLALRQAVGEALGAELRPSEAECRAIALAWQPWRSVAARLFWAYYAARRAGREGVAT